MRGGPADHPLWTNARVIFEFRAPGLRSSKLITLRRPHGLIGSIVGADIPIADTSIGARHAYLHVDDRGVCLIDLASRTGTRLNGQSIDAAWIRVGDIIEIAGREIELREIHLNGFPFAPGPCTDHPLSDLDERVRINLSLEPVDARGTSYVIGSELLFIGQGESCGIRLPAGSAAKTHCALVRSATSAYIIDLLVDRTSVNHQPIRRASRLHDGDLLTVGQSQFIVRLESFSGELPSPPSSWSESPPRTRASEPAQTLMRVVNSIPRPSNGQQPPLESVPAEAQPAVVAWMIGALQASHGELLRRQNELQEALGHVLKQVHEDSSSVMESQNDRIESLMREVDELRRQIDASPTGRESPRDPVITINKPANVSVVPTPAPAPPPAPALLPVPLPTRPDSAAPIASGLPPTEFVGPPAPVSERSRETTSWLLQKIDQVETEKRFSLRSLFGRGGRPRPTADSKPFPAASEAPGKALEAPQSDESVDQDEASDWSSESATD